MAAALTCPNAPAQTTVNRYYMLRAASQGSWGGDCSIHENNGETGRLQFSERILQVFWNEQPFQLPLQLADGRALEVVTPGTWNVAAGPDFRNAFVRVDGVGMAGDVEIHCRAADWQAHGHVGDPAYGRVILHVVWEPPGPPHPDRPKACLHLAPFLSMPWQQVASRLGCENYSYARRVPAGACAFHTAELDDAWLGKILSMAGLARLAEKARALHQQAILKGFAQALYEGLFAALGYRVNQAPMRGVAEAAPLAGLLECRTSLDREAILLGVAGFLPDPTVVPCAGPLRDYVHALWDSWWRSGRTAVGLNWVRAGLRPCNRPERRVMAGALLLDACHCQPDKWLLQLADENPTPRSFLRELSRACTFSHLWDQVAAPVPRTAGRPPHLLGVSRTRDLTTNVVLPFLWAAGEHYHKPAWMELARATFEVMPRLQNNRLFEEAAHRLFVPPSRAPVVAAAACRQQGMLAIYRDFCQASSTNCGVCPFVAVAREAVSE